MAEYGEGVAGHTIARLYSDVSQHAQQVTELRTRRSVVLAKRHGRRVATPIRTECRP